MIAITGRASSQMNNPLRRQLVCSQNQVTVLHWKAVYGHIKYRAESAIDFLPLRHVRRKLSSNHCSAN